MGAEGDELQGVGVWLLVDQRQVGLDVTVPVVFPVARKRMIAILLGQQCSSLASARTISVKSCASTARCGPLASRFKSRLNWLVCLIARIKNRLEFAESHGLQVAPPCFLHRGHRLFFDCPVNAGLYKLVCRHDLFSSRLVNDIVIHGCLEGNPARLQSLPERNTEQANAMDRISRNIARYAETQALAAPPVATPEPA